MTTTTDLEVFNLGDADCRFGKDDDGTVWVVASDFARTLGYRDAANALRILADDEKGTQIVSTPGGPQSMSVVFEDGIWELIFRSTLPGAKEIKTRVKAILREIRETGSYSVQPQIPNHAEALRGWAAEIEAREAIASQLAVAAPKAESWDVLAAAVGDLPVADAAKILSRDPVIRIGRNRLFTILTDRRWVYRQTGDNRYRAMQAAVEAGRLSELPSSHYHPRTGELVLDAPQVRVTVKGLHELHRLLGGQQSTSVSAVSSEMS